MDITEADLELYSVEELAQLCASLRVLGDAPGNVAMIGAIFREGERRLGDGFISLLEQQK